MMTYWHTTQTHESAIH